MYMNMKTMKNILYALFAVAALVMVGCTKDQTYTPGTDLPGEQIYIDNSKSVFYVKTAAEKEEEAKELKKLSKGLELNATYTDDTYVDVKIVRNGSTAEQYDFEVALTMPAANAELFTLPAGSKQTGADQTAKTVVYTVPCSFDVDAAETVLRIGFNLATMATNTEYAFNAALVDQENLSNYGASELDFSIIHSLPIELPFEDIGSVTIEETFFRDMLGYPIGMYSDCVIQIHKDDKKAIDDAKAAGTAPEFAAGYVRFYVPRIMYQIAAASFAANEGIFDEGDLDYFADGCGAMLCMTPTYEPVASDGARNYPHPLYPKQANTGYGRYPFIPVDTTTGELDMVTLSSGTVMMYLGSVPLYITNYGDTYMTVFPDSYGFGTTTRTMNTYSYGVSYWAINSANGSLWPCPINITWDKNTLESDWANYFKVDYNNDVNYSAMGVGIFTSEYQGNFANKYLYKGVEAVSGKTIYYVADPYGTSTQATGTLGLAMAWNGTTANVIDMQPLNMQWNGRELYASQSKKIKSSLSVNERGNVVKLTMGIAIVNEDGQVLGDYTEVFDIEAPEVGLEAFIGEFTQYTYELYGPYDAANVSKSLLQAFYPLSSSVKIEQAVDKSGNPIKNKVKIYGVIASDYDLSTNANGYLEGTYDPETNTIDVPAQFFHDMEWDGTPLVGQAMSIFPYFQPGVTTYNAYNTSKGQYWFSELESETATMAIHYANGMLEFRSSTNCADMADGYSIILGYYDAEYDEFVVDAANMTFYTTISWPSIGVPNPTLVPASGGGSTMPLQQKFVKKSINANEHFTARKTRGEKFEVSNVTIKK